MIDKESYCRINEERKADLEIEYGTYQHNHVKCYVWFTEIPDTYCYRTNLFSAEKICSLMMVKGNKLYYSHEWDSTTMGAFVDGGTQILDKINKIIKSIDYDIIGDYSQNEEHLYDA